MRSAIITLLFLIICTTGFSQKQYTVETIPDPKNGGTGYVSNPDQVLTSATVEYLNSRLAMLEDTTTIQLAVVVVNSIGNEVPGEFRTQLFNYWKIGNKEKDNGFLVLLVMDQHRIEFETGYGLEGVVTDAIGSVIREEYMVPLAKEGKFDECVIAGVDQIIKIVTDPVYRDEVNAYSTEYYAYKPWWRRNTDVTAVIFFFLIYGSIAFGTFYNRKKKLKTAPAYVKNNFSDSYSVAKFSLLNVGLPVAFIGWQEIMGSLRVFEFGLFIYGLLTVLLIEKRIRLNKYIFKDSASEEPQHTYDLLAKSHKESWAAATIFFPLPFIFYSLFNRRRMTALRNTAPLAEDGKTSLIKLNEIKDDDFLAAFQLSEEKLRSVDYDVWKHPLTNEIKIYRFENYFSKYKPCPNCSAKAFLMTKNQTVTAPTYESTGSGLKTYTCKNCGHTKKEHYTIAKRVRSSSSGSGGSGGGGGGSSSWGGGGSGGGGGGSSW